MGDMADDFRAMKEYRRKRKDAVTPSRADYAAKLLREHGHEVTSAEPGKLVVNGYIAMWPFTGWWSGKGVGSGRGVKNLITALKKAEGK